MAVKKKFIEVEIPILGESLSVLGTEETLEGKTIKLDLSRKLRGRGVEIVLVIYNKEGKLVAYPKNLTLMRSYVQRMMRKRISYVEDSFQTTCKDIKITLKPFLITRKKVSRAIRNNLRKTAKEVILEYVKDKTYLEVVSAVLSNNMQRDIHPKLKKVYPLSMCEIRILETSELAKADLTLKAKAAQQDLSSTGKEAELTQAEEIELHQKKKAEAAKAAAESSSDKETAELTQAEEIESAAKPKLTQAEELEAAKKAAEEKPVKKEKKKKAE
ncbi:hypothetical protein KA107_01460 [Candidatus Pacearchaeota archaeon]|nr:hypothetical protein [Candidatus Pacearchaeota archaeon]